MLLPASFYTQLGCLELSDRYARLWPMRVGLVCPLLTWFFSFLVFFFFFAMCWSLSWGPNIFVRLALDALLLLMLLLLLLLVCDFSLIVVAVAVGRSRQKHLTSLTLTCEIWLHQAQQQQQQQQQLLFSLATQRQLWSSSLVYISFGFFFTLSPSSLLSSVCFWNFALLAHHLSNKLVAKQLSLPHGELLTNLDSELELDDCFAVSYITSMHFTRSCEEVCRWESGECLRGYVCLWFWALHLF